MHIAIDARLYGLKNRGLGRFLIEHLKHLEVVDEHNSYSVLLRTDNFDEYEPANPRFKKLLWDVPWYSWREQVGAGFLRSLNADLYYFPHWNVPLFLGKPYVVTIHDMILFDFPDRRASTQSWLQYKLKYAAFRFLVGATMRNAQAVVAVSQATKTAILNHFPKTKNIQVIYEGAPELAVPEVVNLGKHGIQKPYILYVGAAYPHKHLPFLLRSFQHVRTSVDCQLVLVGRSDFFYERLALEARTAGIDRDVVFFGSATDGELAYLYNQARTVVCPSLVEGFGFSGLEALSRGVPVVASRIPCFEEILGQAPLYFDPKDEASCAHALIRGSSDELTRTRAMQSGVDHALKYDWHKSAQQYTQLFERYLPAGRDRAR